MNRIHTRRTALTVLTVLTSTVLAWQPAAAQHTPADSARLATAVDQFVERAMATGLAPALGVALVLDGRTIYSRAFGMANTTEGIRADDRTLWYIASTTKSFTGFGIALLAERGEIDLRAPITKLLPKARWHPKAHPDSLTLADFLTHTQGLDAGAVVINAAFTGIMAEARWPELLVYSDPLPTRDMAYNNLGYNVAAMVIDTRRPEGWRRYLENAVYRPVGMRETYARVSGLDRRRFAMPHAITKTLAFETTPFVKNDATMNSAGGHLATLHDLARWVAVNMNDGVIDGRRVFPAAAMQIAHHQLASHTVEASRTFAFFHRDGWSPGWDIGSYDDEPMISRFGGYESIRSHLSYLPRRHIGVVAQTTASTSGVLTDIVAAYAYDLEAGRANALSRAESRLATAVQRLQQMPQRLAAFDSVTAARRRPLQHPIEQFAGSYEHPGYGTISWTVRDGTAWYTFGAYSGPADIYDAAANQLRIVFGGSGTIVTFTFGPDGPARELTINGVGTFTRR